MREEIYEIARKNLAQLNYLDEDTSFELARTCSALLHSRATESQGRDLVIRALDAWKKFDETTLPVWNDLAESAGLYPYVDAEHLTGSARIRHEFSKSDALEDVYLHEEQLQISLRLKGGESVIVSAPTSFGKSLLIEEVVARRNYRNIVIIQPTLALIDETRKKLEKYQNHYNLVVSTTQSPAAEANIFLFTGERVVQYKEFPPIDFFVLDEFYKLSLERDDERASILNHALYRLLKMTDKFYMLGPNIRSIPHGFAERYKAHWMRTNFSTVAVDVTSVKPGLHENKQEALFKLLAQLEEPTLIYCSAPEKTNQLVSEFIQQERAYLSKVHRSGDPSISEVVQWIDENVHEEWVVGRALQSSVGIHHGALPRHLGSSIVDLFNKGKLRYLFCTSTLIEGVNTSAKNVVLFDRKKGRKPIDYFDFRNIMGRSGRMKVHFIGRVFKFHSDPEQIEVDVDMPLFTQDQAPLELLVQMEPDEIRGTEAQNKIKSFTGLEKELQEVLKRNVGVDIPSQLGIIEEIQKNLRDSHRLMAWNQIPKYEFLKHVLDLGWKYLLKRGESRGGMRSPAQLALFAIKFSQTKSLKALITSQLQSEYWQKEEPEEGERIQRVVHMVLQANLNWFRYKLPKYLVVISELQDYVFRKASLTPGDYNFFASYIENSCLPYHLATLTEYGVPVSALRKLERLVRKPLELGELISLLRRTDLGKWDLIPYEVRKLESLFVRSSK